MLKEDAKLGIIAGGGRLPALLVEHCQENNIPCHMLTFKGQPQPDMKNIENVKTSTLHLGKVGQVVKVLKEHQVTDVVMAGYLSKPSLFDLRLDWQGLKIMNRLRHKHDDALLSAVYTFLEEQGFNVVGAHEVQENLLMPYGILTQKRPNETEKADIELGMEAVNALGALDIGQAVVVKDGVILGLEGAEGTRLLVERCAALRGKANKGGILVKAAKPGQNLRVDMPAVGEETIEQLVRHGYSGLVVLCGQALFIDSHTAIEKANRYGLFICGVAADGTFE